MHVIAQPGKRWGIAILLAVIINVIIVLFLRPMPASHVRHVHADKVVFVRLTHVTVHKKPRIHPKPRIHHLIVKHRIRHIVWHAHTQTASGARARDHARMLHAAHGARVLAVHKELTRPTARPALPVAAFLGRATTAGHGQVAGGSGSTGSGAGGNAGNGAAGDGRGTSGAGTGDGLAPCGSPYIRRRGSIKTYDGYEHVNISIQLALRNGMRSAEEMLPYPLLYRDDAESPFSDRNRNNPKYFTVLLQMPPMGFDQSRMTPMIAQVLAHTTPGGYTSFGPCPSTGNDLDGPP
jgi:hypothetical protein